MAKSFIRSNSGRCTVYPRALYHHSHKTLDKMLRSGAVISTSSTLILRVNIATYLKYALKYTTCHAPKPTNIPIVPSANHLTLSFVLSLVSLSFCSRILRYSISCTISLTLSSIRRSSVSTGFNFSLAWMADQSRASAPMSMSSSTWREGFL